MGWVYPPEVTPLYTRSKAVSLATALNWAGNFSLTFFTPPGFENIQWKVRMASLFFVVVFASRTHRRMLSAGLPRLWNSLHGLSDPCVRVLLGDVWPNAGGNGRHLQQREHLGIPGALHEQVDRGYRGRQEGDPGQRAIGRAAGIRPGRARDR